jgi:c(7)-type cytochrome triheme protein
MSKSDLNYRQGLHRVAESVKSSCAGCHAPSGTAFPSAENCQRCHGDLGTPRATPATGVSGLPDSQSVETRLGPAKFDHARHVTINKEDCRSCHNKIFPLAKGMLNYADNLHATAEQNKSSCGACHRDGGTAFATKNNCLNCHTALNARSDLPALAAPIRYATRLGEVTFNHNRHIREVQGDCTQCHFKVFPMERRELTGYAADYHRTAEANGGLCAACHAPGKPAFATLNNCRKCHLGLERQSAN